MSPLFQNRNGPFRRLVRAPLGPFACRVCCRLYAAAPRSCFNSRGALFFLPAASFPNRCFCSALPALPGYFCGHGKNVLVPSALPAVYLPQKDASVHTGLEAAGCTEASFFQPFTLKRPLTARIPHRKKQGSDKICTAPARRSPGRTERPLCTAQAAPAAPKDAP